MTVQNILDSINEGLSIMVVRDDSDDIVMAESAVHAARHVLTLRDIGYTGKILVLNVDVIHPS